MININGEFYNKEDAKISVFDPGFQYGDGVFETMRTYGRTVFKLDEHIHRLQKSADAIHLRLPWNKDHLMSEIIRTVQKNDTNDVKLKIIVTRGETTPSYIIIIEKVVIDKEAEKGVKAITVNISRFISSAKTCNYLPAVLAKHRADKHKAFEALLCDGDLVREGAKSNIFIVKRNTVITPKENILRGITRDVIIKLAKKHYTVEERNVTKQDLYSAKECFISYTTQEIVPVTKINNVIIGNGKPGQVTLNLITEFKNLVNE